MIKKKFDRDYLYEELDLPYASDYLIQDIITAVSRWSTFHQIVFMDKDGSYWMTDYSCGATELQDERPWEYEDKVECIKVEKKLIQIEKWVAC